jgi:endoglucanase
MKTSSIKTKTRTEMDAREGEIFLCRTVRYFKNVIGRIGAIAMLLAIWVTTAQAAPTIAEIRTAAPKVLVVVLTNLTYERDNGSSTTDIVDKASWRVNGSAPLSVHRYSVTWDERKGNAWNEDFPNTNAFPVTTLHRMYLELSSPLVEGQSYTISDAAHPEYGSKSFVFGARTAFCESIKVNQVGYSKLSTSRYANFGVFMGDGGSLSFSPAPTYKVYDENSGALVTSGTAIFMRDDRGIGVSNSGEYVYRMPLANVPDGGPYYVSVDGAGRSRSFGVGDVYSELLARVTMRGMYLHRCGIALTEPYTAFTHAICHTNIYDARSTSPQDQVYVNTNTTPRMFIQGGYHDAGDMDQSGDVGGHQIISVLMLSFYEAFTNRFVDNQYNIPESGNGIPDFLDEIMWGLKVWEYLQVTNPSDPDYRGVRAGWSTTNYTTYGVDSAANDQVHPELRDPQKVFVYGTQAVTVDATAQSAGIFAQASRLIRPYDSAHADALLNRAQLAWAYMTNHADINEARTSFMYAALQLYLATGNATYHNIFQTAANNIIISGHGYDPNKDWYQCGDNYLNCQIAHFVSYLLPGVPNPNPTLVQSLKGKILDCAETGIFMGPPPDNEPYPQGFTAYLGLGAGTAQGRYAAQWMYACLFTNDPVRLAIYTNRVCQYADYPVGLNPMNMSYFTGLGTDQPNSPLDCNSYFTKYGTNDSVTLLPNSSNLDNHRDANGNPLGNVPGICVYGPTYDEDLNSRSLMLEKKMVPYWTSLPGQRRYTHGHTYPAVNEFTVAQTMTWNALMYAWLNTASTNSGGGGSLRPATVAKAASGTITIDGNLSEPAWQITNTVTKLLEGVSNNTVMFGAMWDTNYLYVGASVLDSAKFGGSPTYLTAPWQGDAIEVYIDGNHNRGSSYDTNDRQIVKGYNNGAIWVNGNQTNGIIHAVTPISGGYSIEMAIPWSNIGITPSSGTIIGFDVANDDNDNGVTNRNGQTIWAGNANNWTSTSAFGDLTLTGGGGTSSDEFTNDANTIALYHFDGDYHDSSGHAFNLTPSGNVSLSSANLGWMQNPSGYAVNLNDLGDQLAITTIPDSAVEPGPSQTPLSIEARIYVRGYKAYSRANASLICLIENQQWDAQFQLYDPIWPASGQPIGPFVAGATTTHIVEPAAWQNAVSLNTWHSFKLTFAADGTAKVYIDGNLVNTVSTSVTVWRTDPWQIILGNFDGYIDEVRISNIVR